MASQKIQEAELKPATHQIQAGAKTMYVGVAQLRAELKLMRGELQDFIREELSLLEFPSLRKVQTDWPSAAISTDMAPVADLVTTFEQSEPDQTSLGAKATLEVREMGADDACDVHLRIGQQDGRFRKATSPVERNASKRMSRSYPMPLFMKEEDDEIDEQKDRLLAGRCLEMKDGISLRACHGIVCEPLHTWVKSQSFEFVVLAIILLNALSIGIQTDYVARHCDADLPWWTHSLNHSFNLCFVAELLVRALAYSSNGSFGSYLANNLVDSVAIIILAVEEALAASLYFFHLGGWRIHHALGIIRMTRALRLIRILRSPIFLRLTHQLRAFIISILDSVQAFLWGIFLILVITYAFSIYITSQVAKFRKEHQNEHHPRLVRDFGSTFQTMRSLLVGMLNGTQWYDTAAPLGACDAWLVFVVAAYMTICILGILNMVTGVFVTNAMKHVDRDKLAVLKIQLTDIFHRSDTNLSGTLTMEELDERLEIPELLTDLQEIDLRPEDARTIFHLLDEQGTGDIDITEMVAAAVHLQGPAKALDLELVKQRQEDMHKLLSEALGRLSSMHVGHL
eukprot:TRINITY_DN108584_c0_g1_i1.p1 TRINITY_DN108584_c0_g1~~TRINITY_DN108584_c0_g1_i1.p1  ORF type:complete len:569 (-),score=77.50 TRINITY_DN108584_c0_g1_i1:201-1907(-)